MEHQFLHLIIVLLVQEPNVNLTPNEHSMYSMCWAFCQYHAQTLADRMKPGANVIKLYCSNLHIFCNKLECLFPQALSIVCGEGQEPTLECSI
jgi:hypothetical protein